MAAGGCPMMEDVLQVLECGEAPVDGEWWGVADVCGEYRWYVYSSEELVNGTAPSVRDLWGTVYVALKALARAGKVVPHPTHPTLWKLP